MSYTSVARPWYKTCKVTVMAKEGKKRNKNPGQEAVKAKGEKPKSHFPPRPLWRAATTLWTGTIMRID